MRHLGTDVFGDDLLRATLLEWHDYFRRRPAAAIFAIRRLPYLAIPAAAATAAGSRAPLFFAARSIALNRAPVPSFGLATDLLPSRPRRWCWPGRGQKPLEALVVGVELGTLKACLEFGLSRRIDRRLQRFQCHVYASPPVLTACLMTANG